MHLHLIKTRAVGPVMWLPPAACPTEALSIADEGSGNSDPGFRSVSPAGASRDSGP